MTEYSKDLNYKRPLLVITLEGRYERLVLKDPETHLGCSSHEQIMEWLLQLRFLSIASNPGCMTVRYINELCPTNDQTALAEYFLTHHKSCTKRQVRKEKGKLPTRTLNKHTF